MNARSQLIAYGREFESNTTFAELVAKLSADFVTEAEAPNRIHG
ncbi:MAG: hypothetical protein ABEJ58_02225 [Halodesulfurarchaeum sp.]